MRRYLLFLFLAGCYDIDGLLHLHHPGGLLDGGDGNTALDGGIASFTLDGGTTTIIDGGVLGLDGGTAAHDLALAPAPDLAPALWSQERPGHFFTGLHALGGEVFVASLDGVLDHRDAAGNWTEQAITVDSGKALEDVVPAATNNLYGVEFNQGGVWHATSSAGPWTQVLAAQHDTPISFVAAIAGKAYVGTSYENVSPVEWGFVRSSTGSTFADVTYPDCASFDWGFASNGTVAIWAYEFDCTSSAPLATKLLVSKNGAAFSSMTPPSYSPGNVYTWMGGLYVNSSGDLYIGWGGMVGHYTSAGGWVNEPFPNPGGGNPPSVVSLDGSGSSDIWGLATFGQVVHFDGVAWSSELLVSPPTAGDQYTSIAVAGPGDVYAIFNGNLYHRRH